MMPNSTNAISGQRFSQRLFDSRSGGCGKYVDPEELTLGCAADPFWGAK